MSTDYDNFDQTMRRLLKVHHNDIREKLAAEKAAKRERSAAKKSSRKNTPKGSREKG